MTATVAEDGLLASTLGGPDVLRVTVAGQLLDPGDYGGAVTITQGRQNAGQQPEPGTCSLTAVTSRLDRLPTIGDALDVELGPDALAWAGLAGAAADAARVRFTGHVTDVAALPDRRGTPATVRLVATTRRARLGRVLVGQTPWPVELDGARAARILADVGPAIGAPVGQVDAGQALVLARDVDRQPALQLLADLATSTGATLVELRDGTLVWHDAEHRRLAATDVTLTAAQVFASVTAKQSLAGLVNDLTLTYGTAPVDGEGQQAGDRPTLQLVDQPSVELFGPFGAKLDTQLADAEQAAAWLQLQLGRRSRPVWELDGLAVDLLRTVSPATAGALLQLQHADLLAVGGFPESGPFATARLWVEGWTESLTRSSWTLNLATSDYGRTGPAPRWVDVPRHVSWADAGALTFLQAAGWDPGTVSQGRWIDAPASVRWQNIDPAVTWAGAQAATE